MKEDSFILVSLKDGKSKKLAQVLTNDSSRKILDFLGRKEFSTESELASELGLPMSTVHYNLRQLSDSGFVVADEFHYSGKGKEVLHYRLANKFIVIAPKTTFGFKQKLREILPVAIAGAFIAMALRAIKAFLPYNGMQPPLPETGILAKQVLPPPEAADAMLESAVPRAAEFSAEAASLKEGSLLAGDFAFWFFVGFMLALAIALFFSWLRGRKR